MGQSGCLYSLCESETVRTATDTLGREGIGRALRKINFVAPAIPADMITLLERIDQGRQHRA